MVVGNREGEEWRISGRDPAEELAAVRTLEGLLRDELPLERRDPFEVDPVEAAAVYAESPPSERFAMLEEYEDSPEVGRFGMLEEYEAEREPSP